MLRPHPPILLRLLTVLGGVAGCDETRQDLGRVRPGDDSRGSGSESSAGQTPMAPGATSGATSLPQPATVGSTAPVMVGQTTVATPPTEWPTETPAPPPQPAVYWLAEVTPSAVQGACPEQANVGPSRAYEVCFLPGDAATAPGVTDVCSPEQAEYTVETVKRCGLGFRASVVCGAHEENVTSLGVPTAGELSGGPGQGADAGQGSELTSNQHVDGGPDAGFAVSSFATNSSSPAPLASRACCTIVGGACLLGRPFTVDGTARLADVRPAEEPDWTKVLPASSVPLSPEQRRSIGECWLQDARSEHASVASFARFTLQCLALGAPVELVLASQQAIADEIEHARLSFGLAQRYLGQIHEPAPLDIHGALADPTLLSVTLSTVSEGCIAETVSAVLLTAARDAARDPEVKTTLSRVVEEELAHAELAWKFVAWALSRAPELTPQVRAVFADAASHVGFGSLQQPNTDDLALRAHGCLPTSELQNLAEGALRDIVQPAALALLG